MIAVFDTVMRLVLPSSPVGPLHVEVTIIPSSTENGSVVLHVSVTLAPA